MSCDERNYSADGMWGLRSHPQCEMRIGSIPLGDATAGFDGSNMDARHINIFLDRDFGVIKVLIRLILIAPFPMPDEIALLIVANLCRARLERFERIHHNRKWIIIHFNRSNSVRSGVAIG